MIDSTTGIDPKRSFRIRGGIVSRASAIIDRQAACAAQLTVTILLASAVGGACSKEHVVEQCPSPKLVCIRVENSSDLDFESFRVNFNGQTESYGPLAAGAVSEYRSVGAAYRYAYTEAFSNKRRFVLQPIDFVGERHLLPGAYTYRYMASVLDEPSVKDDWSLDGYLSVRLIAVAETNE